jgi:hypothetical protein
MNGFSLNAGGYQKPDLKVKEIEARCADFKASELLIRRTV